MRLNTKKYPKNVQIHEKIEYFTRNFTEVWRFYGKPPISRSASRPRNREIGWAVAAAQKAYYKYCGYIAWSSSRWPLAVVGLLLPTSPNEKITIFDAWWVRSLL